MTAPGPSARFVYLFDSTTGTGYDLTATDGQVGEFDPPTFEESITDLTGSASTATVIDQSGHTTTPDTTLPIWAHASLQDLLDDIHGVTASDRRNERVLVIGWYAADAIGVNVDAGTVYLKTATPMLPPAQLTKLQTVWAWDDAPSVATVLHNLTEETADGDTESSSQDNSASSSNGGVGFFGYTSLNLDGGTAFAPRVVDSSDDITFGELIAFTSVTATGGGGQRSEVTGTVERYLASDWDFTGTPGGSAACTFFIAFERL